MSTFGPAGATTGIWECPDLFEVPISNEPGNTKWVLMHSPAPYMQYFIGEFDGISFKNENPPAKVYRPDYGPDYYAAIVGIMPMIYPLCHGGGLCRYPGIYQ